MSPDDTRTGGTRMRMSFRVVPLAVGVVALVVLTGAALGAFFDDWGLDRQTQMENKSQTLFGVGQPLTASSTASISKAQALADPAGLVTLAKGLQASVVAAGPEDDVGPNADQMVLWPPSNPTHIILVNEEGSSEPGLQKVDLATGEATTILTGIDDNDPVRVTPWGTIVFGEEASDGAMYEIIDPLDPSLEGTTLNRATQVFTPSTTKIKRIDGLGFDAFEGLAIMPNGVTYYGNELAAEAGAPAGAYYKFVPTTPRTPVSQAITNLSQSPYTSGKVYAFRAGTNSNNGQGFQYGTGSWQELVGANGQLLKPLAVAAKATGYYRPEDVSIDEAALAAGNVRFCGNETGRDSARYWGETICFTDGTVAASASGSTTPRCSSSSRARRPSTCRTTSRTSRAAGTGSSTRTVRPAPSRRASVRTTTCGTASTTAPTSTRSPTAASASRRSTTRRPSGRVGSSTRPGRTSTSASSTTSVATGRS